MVVAGDFFADVLVFDGELQDGAGFQLTYVGAVDLLPGGLVGAIFDFHGGAAGGDFLVGDEYVDAARIEIDVDLVAGLEDGEVAADGGFG